MATGRDVVGADGLTNAERYKKRQEEKAAKAAARKAKQAEIDKDRPEGVSRYLVGESPEGRLQLQPCSSL
jgi:hypothetical protein